MTLLLIRHGRPDFEPPAKVGRDEVSTALDAYRASTVSEAPPASLLKTLDEYRPARTITSDLPRARSSARALGFDPLESSALWAEADLPHPDRLPMPLPWPTLLVLCRIAWLAGYTRNAAGRAADRRRARAGADRLVSLAGEHGTVALVAHGVINRLIRGELASRGWRAVSRTGDGHWSCAVLEHGVRSVAARRAGARHGRRAMLPTMRIESVNVSGIRTVEHAGRSVRTGFFKRPVEGRVAVGTLNLDGDDQADRRHHGGEHKAVYAFSVAERAWWSERLRRTDIGPGFFGENLSIDGLDETVLGIGDRLEAGSCLFEITQPRVPCFKFGIAAGRDDGPDAFLSRTRPGVYLRVIREGSVGAGDVVERLGADVEEGGDIVTLYRAAFARSRPAAERLRPIDAALANPALSAEWSDFLKKRRRALVGA